MSKQDQSKSMDTLCFTKEENWALDLGFFVHNHMVQSVRKIREYSERNSTLELHMDGPEGDIVYIFVNIHAPTNTLSLAKPSICEKFYTDLENIFRDCKRKTQNVVILGDWNARLADRKWMDGNGIGRFALSGLRNSNGDKMAEFCRLNNMTVLNTIFQKPKSKLVT